MGGGTTQPKKTDPSPPAQSYDPHHLDSKSKDLKTNSDDIDEDIKDYYDESFDF